MKIKPWWIAVALVAVFIAGMLAYSGMQRAAVAPTPLDVAPQTIAPEVPSSTPAALDPDDPTATEYVRPGFESQATEAEQHTTTIAHDVRQQVYYKLGGLLDAAPQIADGVYPVVGKASAKKNAQYSSKLVATGSAEIAKRYHISVDSITWIVQEGSAKDWAKQKAK